MKGSLCKGCLCFAHITLGCIQAVVSPSALMSHCDFIDDAVTITIMCDRVNLGVTASYTA